MTATVSFDDIERARERIGDRVYKTPFPKAEKLSATAGKQVFLKLENLQLTGSFKERGALNKLQQLTEAQRKRGVVAASAGNHAQGLALHSAKLGINAKIVMPELTPLVKVSRTRGYGGEVVFAGSSYDDASAKAHEIAAEEERELISAFDDDAIIAGQGTIGLELLEQNPYVQSIVVPVGGGGLIAGIAVAIKETNPKIRIIGVESDALPAMKRSVEAGERIGVEPTQSIADGIAVGKVGERTFELVQHYVDDIVTVSENDIASAIMTLLEDEKVVAEGAAAATVAAVLTGVLPETCGNRVGCVISGGNIDINVIAQIIDRGLVKAGRRVRLEVYIPDRPGGLAKLTQIVAQAGANILEIHHDRAFAQVQVGTTDVVMTLETRGYDHINALRDALEGAGYPIVAQH